MPNDELIKDSDARRELGGISPMTIWRWDNHPERAPKGWEPPVKLGSRNYRRRSMIERVKTEAASNPAQAA